MPTSDSREPKQLTFGAALDTVEVTPGEASQIFYAWAQNFHDAAPDLAGKLRKAGDNLAYGPAQEDVSDESHAVHATPTRRSAVSQ